MSSMTVRRRSFARACVHIALAACPVAGANAFQLVTEQEAFLPDDPSGTLRGGPSRGPEILVRSPAIGGSLVKSPLLLRIKFQAHGGAKIDRDSVVVTYKKLPPIDLTQRIVTYIQEDGIEIDGAELPPGMHRLQISVSDLDGRKATEFLSINVERPHSK